MFVPAHTRCAGIDMRAAQLKIMTGIGAERIGWMAEDAHGEDEALRAAARTLLARIEGEQVPPSLQALAVRLQQALRDHPRPPDRKPSC